MSQSASTLNPRYRFPAWVRYASLLWFIIWLPVYWHAWGAQNFLHVCDIAVILTCAGLWWSNSLLLSSQAVSSIIADLLWDLDASWRLITGHNLVGGTEYMWDQHYALWIRLLSLFHVVWPILLLLSLKRVGYDRCGFALQSAIAAAAMIASRFTNPALNINYAFRDPLAHRAWGPAPVHVALMWIALVILIYLPTHIALAKLFPRYVTLQHSSPH
jgi:hypothetical protein